PAGVSLQVFDSLGNLVPASSSSAANVDRLASFTAGSAGTYYARLANTAGNVNYSLLVTRNAAVDTEANHSFSTAQSITGTQGVLGQVGAGSNTLTLDWTDSGWWDSTGAHTSTNKNYIVGQSGAPRQFRDFFVFDLTSVTQPITGAELRVYNP